MKTNYHCHPKALVETENIGANTRVWAFAHILKGATIGEDCNICDHVFIENEVVLGNRVTVKCGVQLWDGFRAEDDVFIGPNATFCNDPFPRSKKYPETYPQTLIRNGASIGANSTILSGLSIGRNAMIGAGSVVTRDVPAFAIVTGNPARITRFIDCTPSDPEATPYIDPERNFEDENATTIEVLSRKNSVISQACRNNYLYFKVSAGSVRAFLDNGLERVVLELSSPKQILSVPPLVWCTLYDPASGTQVLTLTDDRENLITEYEEFRELAALTTPQSTSTNKKESQP